MTERFRNPVIKYTTDTLKTLPGSKLRFFQNGTSTPKTVYADKNKVTSLGSVVTADSAGIFVPIFLDGTYRVRLENSAGTTQTGWPVDNVGGEDTQGQLDDWSALQVYSEGDLVTASNGLRYIAKYNASQNLNQEPSISPTFWDEYRIVLDWNAVSTYEANDLVQYTDGMFYQSLAGGNQNHIPTLTAYWKPWWQSVPAIIATIVLSGGGALTPMRNNTITDAGAYTFPLANTVANGTVLVISVPDRYSAFQPSFTASGSDMLRRKTGAYNTFGFRSGYKRSYTFISNGSNEWYI